MKNNTLLICLYYIIISTLFADEHILTNFGAPVSNLIITNHLSNELISYSSGNETFLTEIDQNIVANNYLFNKSLGVKVGNDGHIYGCDLTPTGINSFVFIMDSQGNWIKKVLFTLPTNNYNYQTLAFSFYVLNGNFFIQNNGNIYIDGALILSFDPTNLIYNFTVDVNSNIYGVLSDGYVYKLSRDNQQGIWITTVMGALGISIKSLDDISYKSDGNLYLVANGNNIFKITNTGQVTSVKNVASNNLNDFILTNDGYFYGMYKDTSGYIHLFDIAPNGSIEDRYDLQEIGMSNTYSKLRLGTDGNIYGFAGHLLFKFIPHSGSYIVELYRAALDIVDFTINDNGDIYGITSSQTDPNQPPNYGTIFKITNTNPYTLLYSFSGGSDGSSPQQIWIYLNKLYGVTTSGGFTNSGVLFYLDLQ